MRNDHDLFRLHPAGFLGSRVGRDAGPARQDAEPEAERPRRQSRLVAALRARREARAVAEAVHADRA